MTRELLKALMTSPETLGISVTADHWTDSMNKHQYLGISAFIVRQNPNTMEISVIHPVIALKEVSSKTAVSLKNDFDEVIDAYAIREKLNVIITDGAATNKCAFDSGNEDWTDIYLARLQRGDMDDCDLPFPADDFIKPRSLIDVPSANDFRAPQLHDERNTSLKGAWVWCAAHCLQLVLKHAVYNTGEKSSLNTLLAECATIVSNLRRKDKGRIFKKSLKLFTEIRWDSRLAMIESLLDEDNKVKLIEIADESKQSKLASKIYSIYTPNNLEILNSFVAVLQIIGDKREGLSSDQRPTLANVVVVHNQITSFLTKRIEQDAENSPDIADFCNQLLKCMETKFPLTAIHYAAAMTCPCVPYKLQDALFVDTPVKLTAKKMVQKLFETVSAPGQTRQKTITKLDSAFDHLEYSEEPIGEWESFNRRSSNPKFSAELDWWRKHKEEFPRVFKIACMFMCPATSVRSERLFSSAGHYLGDKKATLKPEKLEAALLYSLNSELLKNEEIDDIIPPQEGQSDISDYDSE